MYQQCNVVEGMQTEIEKFSVKCIGACSDVTGGHFNLGSNEIKLCSALISDQVLETD
jgi:hypothetical protein